MIKLNKTQTEAIAKKVEKEVRNLYAKRNRELIEEFTASEEYAAKKAFIEENISLLIELRSDKSYNGGGSVESLCKMLIDDYCAKNNNIKVPNYWSLQTEVTLATIDADSVNSLVETLIANWMDEQNN